MRTRIVISFTMCFLLTMGASAVDPKGWTT